MSNYNMNELLTIDAITELRDDALLDGDTGRAEDCEMALSGSHDHVDACVSYIMRAYDIDESDYEWGTLMSAGGGEIRPATRGELVSSFASMASNIGGACGLLELDGNGSVYVV